MSAATDELKNSFARSVLNEFLVNETGNSELIDIFDRLTSLYNEVNSVINISALRKTEDIYIKHYLDSIYPFKYFSGECCDVGCGGGFPCIPLAIVTGLNFTGVESVGKKLLLIKRCRSELNIHNINSEYTRAEELAKLHKYFDTVCARAVADTDKVISYCAPLTKPGGRIVLYKTQNDDPCKISVCEKYHIKLENTLDYALPKTDIRRRLFIYKKDV